MKKLVLLLTILSVSFVVSNSFEHGFRDQILCKAGGILFKSLKSLIPEDSSPEQIREVILDTCEKNHIFNRICDAVVLPHLDEIIELIEEGEYNFRKIAEKFNIHCNRNRRGIMGDIELMSSDEEVTYIQNVKDSPDRFCEPCLFYMTFLQNEIGDDLSVDNIRRYLDGTCDQFEFGAESCERIVTSNYDKLINLIQRKETTLDVCTYELRECSIDYWSTEGRADTSSGKCFLCETIIKYFYTRISDGDTIDKIADKLKNVCSKFPIGAGLCQFMVDEYLPVLVDMLYNKYPPTVVCQKIKLCKQLYYEQILDLSAMVYVQEYIENNPIGEIISSRSECTVCEWLVTSIIEWKKEFSREEVQMLLEESCYYFGVYEPTCIHTIRTYIPKVIDSIEDGQYPRDVCVNLNLCAAALG